MCVCVYVRVNDETKCKHQRPFGEAPDESKREKREERVEARGGNKLLTIDSMATLKENINSHLSADTALAPSG